MKIAFALLGLAVAALAAPSVQPDLFRSLQQKGTTTILISFKNSRLAEVRERAAAQKYVNRSGRLNGLYNALKAHADETQANVLALLNKLQATRSTTMKVRQLWITNQIVVRGADAEVVSQLLTSDEISEIREERIFPLEKPVETIIHPDGYVPQENEQWGVVKIDAPSVWSTGNRGKGVVVANIDTGVRRTHVALKDNHRAVYNWYDPYSGTTESADVDGHGTHTMGTMVGAQNGIGVAPEAEWIACLGCESFGCSEAALVECGQWVACPTLPDGSSPNCTLAPDVSSNSWGGGQGDAFYDDVILAWNAAGIAPIFSIGNSGPYCGSANSPGDSMFAIGVGSTTSADAVSSFSSVGPTYRGRRIKPDISAPGSSVVSSYYTSDNAYATLSGTSMAAPHVSGLVALLRSDNTNISVDNIKSALQAGAQPTSSTGQNCGGINESQYPNHHVGAGRISAPASIAAARKLASS